VFLLARDSLYLLMVTFLLKMTDTFALLTAYEKDEIIMRSAAQFGTIKHVSSSTAIYREGRLTIKECGFSFVTCNTERLILMRNTTKYEEGNKIQSNSVITNSVITNSRL
jgi:hypothetical protein